MKQPCWARVIPLRTLYDSPDPGGGEERGGGLRSER